MKKGKKGTGYFFKKNGQKWCQAPFSNGAMDAATAKWGLAPFSWHHFHYLQTVHIEKVACPLFLHGTVMNGFCCHCEERSDVAIPYNKLSLLEAQKIPSLCSGQTWQSLKKRKKDEHREVIEHAF